MKKITSFFIAFLVMAISFAQSDINLVGAGEYVHAYQKSDGSVWQNQWVNGKPTPVQLKGFIGKVVYMHGGQYHVLAIDDLGNGYNINENGKVTKLAYSGIVEAKAFYRTNVLFLKDGTIKTTDDSNGTVNGEVGGTQINSSITIPTGKVVKKIIVSSGVSFGGSALFLLFTDGDLYKYNRGSATGTLVTSKLLDFTAIGVIAGVATTADDFLYIPLGVNGSGYVGLPNGVKAITSIKKIWADAGVSFPIRKMEGNNNTLHIIDAKDYMFGSGSNAQGEVGNGQGIRYGENPSQWDWSNFQLMTGPVKIIADDGNDTWESVETSNSVTFYLHARSKKQYRYSWGRNSRLVLGNGVTLRQFSGNTYPGTAQGMDYRPNYLDVWTPHYIDPLKVTWTVVPNTPGKYYPPVTLQTPVTVPPVVETVTKSFYDSVVNVMQKINVQLQSEKTLLQVSVSNLQSTNSSLSLKVSELQTSVTTLSSDLNISKIEVTTLKAIMEKLKQDLLNVINQ